VGQNWGCFAGSDLPSFVLALESSLILLIYRPSLLITSTSVSTFGEPHESIPIQISNVMDKISAGAAGPLRAVKIFIWIHDS
jgi:hypothetical protein